MFYAELATSDAAAPYIWSLVLSAGMVILSIAPLYVARFQSQFEISDLASLRSMFDRYPDWGKRASWAQQNSFESFTLHAPAALFAVVTVLNGQTLPPLAVAAAIAAAKIVQTFGANVKLPRCWGPPRYGLPLRGTVRS